MTFSEKASVSRIAVLAGILILAAVYCYGHIRDGEGVLLRCLISSAPLAMFIPGVLARRYRSGSLLCFVLLLYFMFETMALFSPGNLVIDIIAMSLVVLLFTVSMFYSRWQQRADVFEDTTQGAA